MLTRLVSVGPEEVRFWDGTELRALGRPWRMLASSGAVLGRVVVILDQDDGVSWWSLESGQELCARQKEASEAGARCVNFESAGRCVLLRKNARFWVWDLRGVRHWSFDLDIHYGRLELLPGMRCPFWYPEEASGWLYALDPPEYLGRVHLLEDGSAVAEPASGPPGSHGYHVPHPLSLPRCELRRFPLPDSCPSVIVREVFDRGFREAAQVGEDAREVSTAPDLSLWSIGRERIQPQ